MLCGMVDGHLNPAARMRVVNQGSRSDVLSDLPWVRRVARREDGFGRLGARSQTPPELPASPSPQPLRTRGAATCNSSMSAKRRCYTDRPPTGRTCALLAPGKAACTTTVKSLGAKSFTSHFVNRKIVRSNSTVGSIKLNTSRPLAVARFYCSRFANLFLLCAALNLSHLLSNRLSDSCSVRSLL